MQRHTWAHLEASLVNLLRGEWRNFIASRIAQCKPQKIIMKISLGGRDGEN